MRNLLLRPWLLLFVAVAFTGQTSDWKTYKNTEGNFAVLFPGNPEDSINKTDSGAQSHTLMAPTKAGVYTVIYTTMAAEQPVNDVTYQTFKKAVFQELPKCDVEREQAPAPALEGYIGHWYQLSCAMPNVKVAIEGNLYWGKHYAYAVMVMYPMTGSQPEGAQKSRTLFH